MVYHSAVLSVYYVKHKCIGLRFIALFYTLLIMFYMMTTAVGWMWPFALGYPEVVLIQISISIGDVRALGYYSKHCCRLHSVVFPGCDYALPEF